MTPQELQAIADSVVERARPGEQVEAVASWSRDTETRAHDGSVEHFVSAESAGIGIRVVADGRQGLAWATVLDDESIARSLEDARDNARFSSPDPDAGLAEPDGVHPVSLNLADPSLVEVDPERKIDLVLELDRLVRDGDPRIRAVESADYADSVAAGAIATTTGLRHASSETSAYLGVYSIAGDDVDTSTGFGFSVGRGLADLEPAPAATDAVERAVRLLGASKAASQRLTIVLDPYVCSQMVGLIAEMLCGDAVLRGRSPFAQRRGESVASPMVTLRDDATDPRALTSAEVDGEGLACRPVPLIDNGVLTGFLHNAYTARAMGESSTGSAQRSGYRGAPGVGPHVASLAAGSGTHEDILATVGDGVVVYELSGLHSGVNPVSGDLSVGIEGRMLRGGELAEPVREVTIASTLQRMLVDVVALGGDTTYFPWEATGVTLAVADVMMSGF